MNEYRYIGSKITDDIYRGAECNAVRRENGKCIRGKNGSMLVEFDGVKVNVIGRLLRKTMSSVRDDTKNENRYK